MNLRKFLPIVGLEHSTSSVSLLGILRYGFLTIREIASHSERKLIPFIGLDIQYSDTSWDAPKEGNAFPGIYFTAVYDSDLNKGSAPRYRRKISIIVDPYILNRYDYHINPKDDYGQITSSTYSRETIDKFLSLGKRAGEIVFHNRISPIFIKAILTDESEIDDLKNLLDKEGLSMYKYLVVEDIYQAEPYYETDQKLLSSNEYTALSLPLGQDPNALPAFCTMQQKDDIFELDNLVKTAANCGMSAQELRTVVCADSKNASECERAYYRKLNRDKTTNHVPVYFPPLEHTPLREQDLAIRDLFTSDKLFNKKPTPFAEVLRSSQLTGIYGRLSILEDLVDIYMVIDEANLTESKELSNLKEAISLLYSNSPLQESNPILAREVFTTYGKQGVGSEEVVLATWARDKDNQLRTLYPNYASLSKSANSKLTALEFTSRLAINQCRYNAALAQRISNLLIKAYPDKKTDLEAANDLSLKTVSSLV